jgi:hypothetical protein
MSERGLTILDLARLHQDFAHRPRRGRPRRKCRVQLRLPPKGREKAADTHQADRFDEEPRR